MEKDFPTNKTQRNRRNSGNLCFIIISWIKMKDKEKKEKQWGFSHIYFFHAKKKIMHGFGDIQYDWFQLFQTRFQVIKWYQHDDAKEFSKIYVIVYR